MQSSSSCNDPWGVPLSPPPRWRPSRRRRAPCSQPVQTSLKWRLTEKLQFPSFLATPQYSLPSPFHSPPTEKTNHHTTLHGCSMSELGRPRGVLSAGDRCRQPPQKQMSYRHHAIHPRKTDEHKQTGRGVDAAPG